MPHSAGGSSHSGGSHSGSSSRSHSHSSGGHSGSSNSSRTSSTPFKGSRRYLYYQDNKPCLIYSNYDIRKMKVMPIVVWIIYFVFLFAPFMAMFSFFAFKQLHVPKKVTYYQNKKVEYVIEDNIDVLENEKALKKSMKEFYEKTGVVPAVITVDNETWNQDYKDLEKYAYDVSVKRFPDEAHWLIIYSTNIKDNGFDDWYCEIMQGDRADAAISAKHGEQFNEALYKRLLQRSDYSVDEALAQTFDEFTPKMMTVSLDNTFSFFGLLFVNAIMAGGAAWTLIDTIRKAKVPAKYKKAVLCDLNAVYQGSCNFCGGAYIIGMHTECPHCGGALPPQSYVQDPQGNVIHIFNSNAKTEAVKQ